MGGIDPATIAVVGGASMGYLAPEYVAVDGIAYFTGHAEEEGSTRLGACSAGTINAAPAHILIFFTYEASACCACKSTNAAFKVTLSPVLA